MRDILKAVRTLFVWTAATLIFMFIVGLFLSLISPADAWQNTMWGSNPLNSSPWQDGQPVQVHSYDWSTGNRTDSTIYKYGNRYNINSYDFNTGWKQKTCYQNGNQLNCYGY